MLLRRKEYLPRNIDKALAGKESGQIGWTTGLFFILFLGVMLCAVLQLEQYRAVSLYLEDSLAASNLASAVIDVQEYGISHHILIAEPERAYETYRWAVMGNLNLSASWEGQAGSLVQGKVSVVRYIVYNVKGNEVTVYHFDAEGQMTQWQDVLGNAVAPNNVRIENTSVYSEIAFEVEGLFGIKVRAHKGNLADVAR